MKFNKKWLSFLSLFLVLLLITSCGGSPTEKKLDGSEDHNASVQSSAKSETEEAQVSADFTAKGEVTIWMKKQHIPEMNALFEQQCEEIGKKLGVKIKCEIISYEDFPQKWAAAIESKDVPDLSFMSYGDVGLYQKDGLLEDMTDVVAAIQKNNGAIFENLMDPVTFAGKSYMAPIWAESQILYYRTDLIKTPPKTWDEFREIAKTVTNAESGVYGAGIGFGKGNSDAEFLTRAMLWANGASVVDAEGKANLSSPEAQKVAQNIYDMFSVDKSIPPSAANWDDAGNNQAYISQQAAMIFNVGSVIGVLKNEHPDLYEKTALAPFPEGSKGRFVPGLLNGFVIFKDAKNISGAKAVTVELMEKSWYEKWLKTGAPLCLPVLKSVAKEGIWTDEKVNKPFVDQISSFTFIGYPQQYNAKAGEVYNLRIINDTFQKILSGSCSIDEALKWADEQVDAVYNK